MSKFNHIKPGDELMLVDTFELNLCGDRLIFDEAVKFEDGSLHCILHTKSVSSVTIPEFLLCEPKHFTKYSYLHRKNEERLALLYDRGRLPGFNLIRRPTRAMRNWDLGDEPRGWNVPANQGQIVLPPNETALAQPIAVPIPVDDFDEIMRMMDTDPDHNDGETPF